MFKKVCSGNLGVRRCHLWALNRTYPKHGSDENASWIRLQSLSWKQSWGKRILNKILTRTYLSPWLSASLLPSFSLSLSLIHFPPVRTQDFAGAIWDKRGGWLSKIGSALFVYNVKFMVFQKYVLYKMWSFKHQVFQKSGLQTYFAFVYKPCARPQPASLKRWPSLFTQPRQCEGQGT